MGEFIKFFLRYSLIPYSSKGVNDKRINHFNLECNNVIVR